MKEIELGDKVALGAYNTLTQYLARHFNETASEKK